MSSKQKLISLFQASDVDFDITKLVLSDPYPIEETAEQHNTGVVIKASPTETGYVGVVNYTYYRIPLDKLFKGVKPRIDLRDIKTHADAIRRINNRFGLEIVADEFEESNPTIENGYTLKAKATNYEYVGEIHFEHAIPLRTTKKRILDGFKYPDDNSDLIQGTVYSNSLQPTELLYLYSLKQGDVITSQLFASLLSHVTTDGWLAVAPKSEFNIYNSVVESVDKAAKDGVETVTVTIKLNPEHCSNIAGKLMLKSVINVDELPNTIGKEYTALRDTLSKLSSNTRLSDETVSELNDGLISLDLDTRVSNEYTVVYNGQVSKLPSLFVNYVYNDAFNIAILINGFDDAARPVVLAYN